GGGALFHASDSAVYRDQRDSADGALSPFEMGGGCPGGGGLQHEPVERRAAAGDGMAIHDSEVCPGAVEATGRSIHGGSRVDSAKCAGERIGVGGPGLRDVPADVSRSRADLRLATDVAAGEGRIQGAGADSFYW